MNNLQEVVRYVRSAIDQHCVFVHMTAPQIETLLNGMEELQKEIERLKGKVDYKSTIIGYSVELIEDLEKEHKAMKETLEWYADEKNHEENVTDQWEPFTPIRKDEGEKARVVLSTLSKEESA